MYSPTELLVEVNKVAKEYPGAGKHVNAIREAMDVSRDMPPRQRLSAIERALVSGLVSKSFRNDAHMSKLTRAWNKYRLWHAKHGKTAYAAAHATRRPTLKSVPAHVFRNKIGSHLSDTDMVRLAQAFKGSNNPAGENLNGRRTLAAKELEWWATLGARLVKLPFEAAVAQVDGLARVRPSNSEAPHHPVRVQETARATGVNGRLREAEYMLYGPKFGAYYAGSSAYPHHRFIIFTRVSVDRQDQAHQDMLRVSDLRARGQNNDANQIMMMADMEYDDAWGTRIEISRVKERKYGSTRVRTRVNNVRFLPEWAAIVRAAVAAEK